MYLIVGLALLAMSFDLMQAEIIAKFVWLGQKLGISSQNEGEENDDKHDIKIF